MDLRTLPSGLTPSERCAERRRRVEEETKVNMNLLATDDARTGQADEKNCEQMIGAVALPVGIAGPLAITFSSGEKADVFLPLATTEAALVASVNRGCKVLTNAGGVHVRSVYHGMSRTIVLKPKNGIIRSYTLDIRASDGEWKKIGEKTSNHLKILRYEIDETEGYVFLTIFCDTSEAMGMNMTTIAAQAIGDFLAKELDAELITVAGNVDSDKKPSKRTHDRGRGYEVTASAVIHSSVIEEVLKTTPEKLLTVADAKLRAGSKLAGAIGSNLHAANIIAALYLATGQDAAHVVEGSLADTTVEFYRHNLYPPCPLSPERKGESPLQNYKQQTFPLSLERGLGGEVNGIYIQTRLPAILVGVRGGGTALPAQRQCLNLLLGNSRTTNYQLQATSYPFDSAQGRQLQATSRLAETIGAAVLAGELSLLAAQASQTLAAAHKKLAR